MGEILYLRSGRIAKRVKDLSDSLSSESFIANALGWNYEGNQLREKSIRLKDTYERVFFACGGDEEILKRLHLI